MYRILLQTKAASLNTPAAYQYLVDGNTVWETDNKEEALARFEEELNNYKLSLMTLVKTIAVDLNPTADNTCEHDNSTSDPSDPSNP